MSEPTAQHWSAVYRDKTESQTSWFRPHLEVSLRLIDALDLPKEAPLIDVGGGRATLVDDLLARGFLDLTVLDIARTGLDEARARLGPRASAVRWWLDDILRAALPEAHYALWHDRAVFHFLVEPPLRARYVAQAAKAVRPGGHLIVATFAVDGPERCSGLAVRRYEAKTLAAEFEPVFEWCDAVREEHVTPWGVAQPFTYVLLRRGGARSR
jgi:SAM-dependent methyltransferase